MTIASSAPLARTASPLPVLEIARETYRRQPMLASVGLLMLALMVPTSVAYLLDTRVLNDVNVWKKPLKFEFSLFLFFVTIAWFWGYIDEATREGRFLRRFAQAATAMGLFEMGYIIIQAARGEHSHFNFTSLAEIILYQLMGLGVVALAVLSVVVGIAMARRPVAGLSPAFHLSVVLGLVLTLILGGGAGAYMGFNGGHWVGGVRTDLGGFPIFGWSRTGGDLRVAHFFGLHAMHILPVIGLIVAAWRPQARSVVWIIAAAFTALTVYTFVEAVMGQPFLPFIG